MLSDLFLNIAKVAAVIFLIITAYLKYFKSPHLEPNYTLTLYYIGFTIAAIGIIAAFSALYFKRKNK